MTNAQEMETVFQFQLEFSGMGQASLQDPETWSSARTSYVDAYSSGQVGVLLYYKDKKIKHKKACKILQLDEEKLDQLCKLSFSINGYGSKIKQEIDYKDVDARNAKYFYVGLDYDRTERYSWVMAREKFAEYAYNDYILVVKDKIVSFKEACKILQLHPEYLGFCKDAVKRIGWLKPQVFLPYDHAKFVALDIPGN